MSNKLEAIFQLSVVSLGHPETTLLDAGHLAKTMSDTFKRMKDGSECIARPNADDLALIDKYPEMSEFLTGILYDYGDSRWSIGTARAVLIALLIPFHVIYQKHENQPAEKREIAL